MFNDNRYTAEEIEIIMRGEIPPGRKRHAVQMKAKLIGAIIPRIIPEKWTDEELDLLRANKPIPTRKLKACYTKASKLGICYSPRGISFKKQRAIAKENKDAIIEEVKRTGNIRATGRKYGVSYATVSSYAKAAGITNNPSPKERRGQYVEYGGSLWVWCNRPNRNAESYWRETSGKRRNLARVIWEEHNGPIPAKHCVIFKNGDRMDLRVENLVLISASDFARGLHDNPERKEIYKAAGTLGRLNKTIRRKTDPEYDKKIHDTHAEVCRIMRQRRKEKGP